jgi:SAM-dependent methyltransferase
MGALLPVLVVLGMTWKPIAESPASADEPVGVARIRKDAEQLSSLATTSLGKQFLAATSELPNIATRTIHQDPLRNANTLMADAEADKLSAEGREKLKKISVDESLYYHTKYGSPLAYLLPLEILGRAGLTDVKGRKILDFGYGGIGHLRLLAVSGAEAVGVDVDPFLRALYSAPGDQGIIEGKNATGRVTLVDGRFPKEMVTTAKVRDGYDVILSKNTLKRGYIHPERPADKRRLVDLGVDDSDFLRTLHRTLKDGGRLLIYNLCPAQSPLDKPYLPHADGRSPFDRNQWEEAGFRILAFDKDDSLAARALARALGWDRGAGAMDLEKDLFATYTLVEKLAANP